MATSTEVPIYTNTLATTASSVVIDISAYQQYTNLIIRGIVRSNDGNAHTDLYMRCNGDTTGVYSGQGIWGSGSSPAGASQYANTTSADTSYWISNAAESSTAYSTFSMTFLNYASTSMYKTVLTRTGSLTLPNETLTSYRVNGSPITTITLYPQGGSFSAGSTFSVYGVGSASLAKATGGAIYSDSTYWYHVFTSTAAFVPSQSLTADILVVAGGGAGGAQNGGGGGAGGLFAFNSQSLTSGTSYTCSVGAGGTSVYQGSTTNGTNSSFTGLTTVIGGGAGGFFWGGGSGSAQNGGSGGGAAGIPGNNLSGGSPTSGQGYAGGSTTTSVNSYGGAGGGGAGGAGANCTVSEVGGVGGVGATSSLINAIGAATGAGQLSASNYYFAGGGGGGGGTASGSGGVGGGGAGRDGATGYAGLINTGGGGGAARGANPGGAGGSGIVIVRYAR